MTLEEKYHVLNDYCRDIQDETHYGETCRCKLARKYHDWSHKLDPGCPNFEKISESEIDKAIEIITGKNPNEEYDPVNRPSHYTDGNIEVIDFIEDKKLGFHLGNVVKYVARAGKKDPTKTVQDLEKAEFYLKRYIEKLKEA